MEIMKFRVFAIFFFQSKKSQKRRKRRGKNVEMSTTDPCTRMSVKGGLLRFRFRFWGRIYASYAFRVSSF